MYISSATKNESMAVMNRQKFLVSKKKRYREEWIWRESSINSLNKIEYFEYVYIWDTYVLCQSKPSVKVLFKIFKIFYTWIKVIS